MLRRPLCDQLKFAKRRLNQINNQLLTATSLLCVFISGIKWFHVFCARVHQFRLQPVTSDQDRSKNCFCGRSSLSRCHYICLLEHPDFSSVFACQLHTNSCVCMRTFNLPIASDRFHHSKRSCAGLFSLSSCLAAGLFAFVRLLLVLQLFLASFSKELLKTIFTWSPVSLSLPWPLNNHLPPPSSYPYASAVSFVDRFLIDLGQSQTTTINLNSFEFVSTIRHWSLFRFRHSGGISWRLSAFFFVQKSWSPCPLFWSEFESKKLVVVPFAESGRRPLLGQLLLIFSTCFSAGVLSFLFFFFRLAGKLNSRL